MIGMNREDDDLFEEDDELSRIGGGIGKFKDRSMIQVNHVYMGELLFPSFNTLVPQFVEFIIPNVTSLSS